jgi:acylphosphatase
MMRLTAYVSGRVQRVGYRAKVVSLAGNRGLVGIVQNYPDGRVLVIAEGDKVAVEEFASAIKIENALINVENVLLDCPACSPVLPIWAEKADLISFPPPILRRCGSPG